DLRPDNTIKILYPRVFHIPIRISDIKAELSLESHFDVGKCNVDSIQFKKPYCGSIIQSHNTATDTSEITCGVKIILCVKLCIIEFLFSQTASTMANDMDIVAIKKI
ncbi:hypothetical protein KW819_23365, partial [Enterobacter quasiroggenkampii]